MDIEVVRTNCADDIVHGVDERGKISIALHVEREAGREDRGCGEEEEEGGGG